MLERHWKYHPAIKIGLPLAAGIVAGRMLPPPVEGCLLGLLIALGWLLLAVRGHSLIAPLALVLFFSGMLAIAMASQGQLDRLRGAAIRDALVVGRVAEGPIFKADRIEYRLEVDSIGYRNSTAHLRTGLLLRLYDTTRFDPELLPRIGDHVSLSGEVRVPDRPANPGEFDYAAYLHSQRIGLTMSARRASSIFIFERADIPLLERAMMPVRSDARAFADRYVRGEEGDIVRALLIGERDYIDLETRRQFMRTGTIHLLSVSGLHVGVIAMVLFVAVSWVRNRWVQLAAFIVMIGAYTIVAGGGPSIVRAALMASALMLARTAGRTVRPLNTLGFAFTAILLLNPDQLFDVGFQLSFASVAGIMLLYGPLERALLERLGWLRRHPLPRNLLGLFLLSLCAQLLTLPLIIYHFGYVSMVGLLVNIPVVPLYSIALGAALAGAIAAPLMPMTAGCLGGTAHLVLHTAGILVEWGAKLSCAGIEIGRVGSAGALLLGIALLYLAFSRAARQATVRAAVVGLVAAAIYLQELITDPLAPATDSLLFILKGRSALMVGTIRSDTLRLFIRESSDSSAASLMGESLRSSIGAAAVRTIVLNAPDPAEAPGYDTAEVPGHGNDGDLLMLLVNERPREALLTELPVILSDTRVRPFAIVSVNRRPLLQIPMRAELGDAVILRYRGAWELVEWH